MQIEWKGTAAQAIAGEWLVQFDGVTGSSSQQAKRIQDLLDSANVDLKLRKALGYHGLSDGLALLETPKGIGYEQILASLAAIPGASSLQPNFVYTLCSPVNDPNFDELWGLHNYNHWVAGTPAIPDADIDAPEAWGLSTGSPSIIVAVLDSGVDYTHPDLDGNIWINPGEIPGNLIDDDGNGFVDDVRGWDFVNNDNDPMDDLWHGTHVAGTIAAEGNNSTGVTGVSWQSKIMSLKVADSGGYVDSAKAAAAINYATWMRMHGVNVRVTNNSYVISDDDLELWNAVQASGEAGILCVASAGNTGTNNDDSYNPSYPYPCPASFDLPNVISVAMSDPSDELARIGVYGSPYKSNYGKETVDLAAPGVMIRSTYPTVLDPQNPYRYAFGTSMAAPHVSGVAALAWSIKPDATVQEIRHAILNGVDVKPGLVDYVATGGRLNAYNTLYALLPRAIGFSPFMTFQGPPKRSFTVCFGETMDSTGINAAGFKIDGKPADSFTYNGSSITFHFNAVPYAMQGTHTATLDQGAVAARAGVPVVAWSTTFEYDADYDTVGVYNPNDSQFHLSNTLGGQTFSDFVFGAAGWKPIVGDWNGDGVDTVGIYDPSTSNFYLTNNYPNPTLPSFNYGGAGWLPIAGDWDGDGIDTVGVYVPSTAQFYLTNTFGNPSFTGFIFGGPGWVPLAGDWNGDGKDTIGVYNPSDGQFHLSNTLGGGTFTDFIYGGPGWKPLVGDWDGDGVDTVGVYVPSIGHFYLTNTFGNPSFIGFDFGGPGWVPLAGNWNGYPVLVGPLPTGASTEYAAFASDATLGSMEAEESLQPPASTLSLSGDKHSGAIDEVLRVDGPASNSLTWNSPSFAWARERAGLSEESQDSLLRKGTHVGQHKAIHTQQADAVLASEADWIFWS